MVKFEETLENVIGFGRYQILICFMVAWFGIPSGTNVIGPVFHSHKLPHRCRVPGLDNLTTDWTHSDGMLSRSIPYDHDAQRYRECVRYEFNLTACDGDRPCVDQAMQIACDNGFQYDRSLFTETIVSEFDLVCGHEMIKTLSTSLYMLGIFFSALVFGNVCDRYGRKPTMVLTSIGSLTFVVAESLSPNSALFCASRFMLGFFSAGVTMSTFVYVMEITPIKWRARVGLCSQMFFAIGYVTMSGVSYLWRNWRQSLQFTTLFYAPFMVFLFFIPRSPRWLFTAGRVEEGKRVTRNIIRKNGGKIDGEQQILDQGENGLELKIGRESAEDRSEVGKTKNYTTLDVFKTAMMRRVSAAVMFIWFVDSFVFYGISLNAGALAGNLFANHALNGVMQLAGYTFCVLLMDRIGRRALLTLMMILSGSGLIISTIIKSWANVESVWTSIGLFAAFTGKFGISGAYAVSYNFTSELFPTVVRSNGLAIGSMSARIGGVLAPFFIALQNHVWWLPNVIFTILAWTSATVCLFLPETTNQGMTETIPEAELFYQKSMGKPLKRPQLRSLEITTI